MITDIQATGIIETFRNVFLEISRNVATVVIFVWSAPSYVYERGGVRKYRTQSQNILNPEIKTIRYNESW